MLDLASEEFFLKIMRILLYF